MNLKKHISVFMALILLTLCFSSCQKQNKNETSASSTAEQSTIESENESSASSSAEQSTTESENESSASSSDEQNITESETQDVNGFVSLSQTDTGFGLVTIPVFSAALLNSEIAEKANDFFAEIKEKISDSIEGYKLSDDSSKQAEKKYSPLCTVKTADSGKILSVLVEYYFYGSSQAHYEAINFNTQTGNPISPDDVSKKLGYTQDDIVTSLRSYAFEAMFSQWEYQVFCDFAQKEEKPDGIGDPSFGWQPDIDEVEADYRFKEKSYDEKWADLPLCPTVFADENNQLFVRSNVPSSLDDETYETMVCIGHDNNEALFKNPKNPHGEPLVSALVENAALEAVAITMGLDENMTDSSDEKYGITCKSLAMFNDGSTSQPAYICKAKKNGGANRWFAVGAFTASVWEKDAKSGKWKFCADKDSFLPENVFSDNQKNKIIASIFNNPSDLEAWCFPIAYNVDLTVLTANAGTDMGISETSIVIAKEDNTKITFTDVAINTNDYKAEPTSKLCSYTLDKGQCILVSLVRPEVIPAQAIIAENGKDKGIYVIQFDGSGEAPKTEYITIG